MENNADQSVHKLMVLPAGKAVQNQATSVENKFPFVKMPPHTKKGMIYYMHSNI